MIVRYDTRVDAATLDFETGKRSESSAEIAPGFIVDFDCNGAVVSLEVLDAKKTYPALFSHRVVRSTDSPGDHLGN
ncbi:MAG: DUF2283 domain-containing protein [Candidatus Eremiobacteraeota bacterium]|nr:DUF2283 domain-containing protein [Candidatus Eremiobacteraeota bacterium]MBV8354072.1 DUF2283 domain-containing protein [Candidatus Eremiobacteraeota bacterium]